MIAPHEWLADAVAMAADDRFAQVGITLTPEELRRIAQLCHAILLARLPLPADVARLVQRHYEEAR